MATYFIQNTNNVEDIEQMNNVIDKVNQANTTATSNIGQLTDLNNKATELSNNIQQALPLNSELVKNTESAKVANTNLLTTNQEAVSKNTELQASLEKTKEFIEGLDGSQNIPQIRMDVTKLQNGLKSNQSLAYTGSSISANDTLEGRTEGMKIGGRTLVNLVKYRLNNQKVGNPSLSATLCTNEMFKTNTTYTIIYTINSIETGTGKTTLNFSGGMIAPDIILNSSNLVGTHKQTFTLSTMPSVTHRNVSLYHLDRGTVKLFSDVLIIEGEVDFVPNYFEGLKSFGEAEQEGDKYKISILSHGKNLLNPSWGNPSHGGITITRKNDAITLSGNAESLNNWSCLEIPIYLPKGNWYFSYKAEGNGFLRVSIVDAQTRVTISGDVHPTLGKTFQNDKDRNVLVRIFLKGDKETGEITNKYWDMQLEEGTKATPYEPYKQDKKDILIKSPLREWDSMYEDNGQVKVDRYTSVIDFSNLIINVSEISERPNAQSTNWFQTNFIPQLKNAKKNTLNFNNKYVGVDAETAWKDTNDFECLNVAVQEGGVRIQGRVKKGTTIEQLNEKLRGLIIYYQLATPTTEIVENCVDIDLDTFQDKTYFSIENSLPGTLDFKVPSNIASIVQNTAREVNNIWDVINNLLVPSLIDINKNVAMSTIKNNLK